MRDHSDRNDDEDFGLDQDCGPDCQAEGNQASESDTCSGQLQDDVPTLLEHQLTAAIGVNYNVKIQARLRRDAVQLYFDLGPEDVIDTILARQSVMLNNVVTLCFERFACGGREDAKHSNAKAGVRASALLLETVKHYEARRQRRQAAKLKAEEAKDHLATADKGTGRSEAVPRSKT